MGRYSRAFIELSQAEALKKARDWRKRIGLKLKVRKDPNGLYELWVWGN